MTAGRAGSSNCTARGGLRQPLRDLRDVRGGALGQRGGEVGDQAGIGERGVQRAGLLDRRGERPRPAYLYFEESSVAVEGLLHRVQVGGEHAAGAAQVPAGVLGDAPASWRDFDGDADQERGGAAGQVGAGAPARKFG